LYVGTSDGKLAKLTLHGSDVVIESVTSSIVSNSHCSGAIGCRAILGIAFDPLSSTQTNPPVYVAHGEIFHGESNSSSGDAINGKVSVVSGSNLDVILDVITGKSFCEDNNIQTVYSPDRIRIQPPVLPRDISGLPVSDHDHSINGMQFLDHGELITLVGGNTNGGVPG
jgi:hypothetical protein